MVAPSLAAAQALVEVVVLGGADLALALLLAVERDVEADAVDAVPVDQLVGQVRRRVDDHRGVRSGTHRRSLYQFAPRIRSSQSMGNDARHRGHRVHRLAPGPRARRARRRLADPRPPELRPRPARRARVRARDGRRHGPPGGPPRDGRGRAGVPRRRAGPRCASEDRAAVWETNAARRPVVFEEALAAGVERVVHTSTVGAIGVAKPKGAIDETATFDIGHLGIAYVNSKHEAELEALRAVARGLDGGDREPVVRARPGRAPRYVDGPRPPLPAAPDPGLRGRRPQHRRRPRRRRRPPARRREGRRSASATSSPGRNFTLDRLFADLARISGVEPPSLKLPGQRDARRARGRVARRTCRCRARRTRCARRCSGGPTGTRARSRSWASGRGRTRRRSTTPCAGRRRAGRPGGRERRRSRAAGDGRGRAGGPAWRVGDPSMSEVVLYRCRTPTNVLCPCGAVERKLRKLGVEHRTERVPAAALEPARDRGADRSAPRAGAGRRRRGRARLEADRSSTSSGSTPSMPRENRALRSYTM